MSSDIDLVLCFNMHGHLPDASSVSISTAELQGGRVVTVRGDVFFLVPDESLVPVDDGRSSQRYCNHPWDKKRPAAQTLRRHLEVMRESVKSKLSGRGPAGTRRVIIG